MEGAGIPCLEFWGRVVVGSWSGCTGRAIEFGVSVKGGRGRVRLRRGRVGAGQRVGSFGERGIRGRGFGEGRVWWFRGGMG